tara:strand:+ start:109 stop:1308 length:1200 start_codon:yes stop_codon:yes gene_type:complete
MENNNNKINYKYQEIDLIALFISFWSEKKKIYYFILFYIGLALLYLFFVPNLYKISIKINPSEKSNFIKYQNLNKNLDYLTNHLSKNKSDSYGKSYAITPENIFNNLIKKLTSNERMHKILENDPVIKKISSEENNLLLKLKDSFIIGANLKNKYTISFIWNDVDEGKYLLKHVVNLHLINMKKNMLANFNQLEDLKEEYVESKIASIKNELSMLEDKINNLRNEIFLLKKARDKEEKKKAEAEAKKIKKKLATIIDKECKKFGFHGNNLNFVKCALEISNSQNDLAERIIGDTIDNSSLESDNSSLQSLSAIYLQRLLELNGIKNPIFIEKLQNQKQILDDDEQFSDWVSFDENYATVNPTKLGVINILIMAIILGFVSGILYLIIINLRQNLKIERK